MGIDWEDILGEDLPLQEAYDRLLFGSGESLEDPADQIDRFLSGPIPEDDGRDEPEIFCDGNYPYCTGCCDDCRYCRSCSAAGSEVCDGRCWKCPYSQAVYWPDEADELWLDDDELEMAEPGQPDQPKDLPIDEFDEEPVPAPTGEPADETAGEPAAENGTEEASIEEVERELI